MPAPPLRNTFEGGSDGVTISAANSGGESGDAFQTISGTPIFSTTHAWQSVVSQGIIDGAGTTFTAWTGLGSITTNVYYRVMLWVDAYPSTNSVRFIRSQTTAGAALCSILELRANGKLQATTAASVGIATGTVDVALGQWVRVEWRVLPSTTVGEVEWRLYNDPDGGIADTASATGQVLGANVDTAQFGLMSSVPATPYSSWLDAVAVSTTGWIGPIKQGLPADNRIHFIYLRKNK